MSLRLIQDFFVKVTETGVNFYINNQIGNSSFSSFFMVFSTCLLTCILLVNFIGLSLINFSSVMIFYKIIVNLFLLRDNNKSLIKYFSNVDVLLMLISNFILIPLLFLNIFISYFNYQTTVNIMFFVKTSWLFVFLNIQKNLTLIILLFLGTLNFLLFIITAMFEMNMFLLTLFISEIDIQPITNYFIKPAVNYIIYILIELIFYVNDINNIITDDQTILLDTFIFGHDTGRVRNRIDRRTIIRQYIPINSDGRITIQNNFINSLPSHNTDSEYICGICLSNNSEHLNNISVKLQCNHIFHRYCLNQCTNAHIFNCPMCRANIITDNTTNNTTDNTTDNNNTATNNTNNTATATDNNNTDTTNNTTDTNTTNTNTNTNDNTNDNNTDNTNTNTDTTDNTNTDNTNNTNTDNTNTDTTGNNTDTDTTDNTNTDTTGNNTDNTNTNTDTTDNTNTDNTNNTNTDTTDNTNTDTTGNTTDNNTTTDNTTDI